MTRLRLARLALAIAGLVALGIGATILTAPEVFFASNGIALGRDAALLSEIRAPAGALVGAGLLMLLGVFVPGLANAGLLIAVTLYLGYGAARLVSMAVDGLPGGSLIAASGVELAIGLLCLIALMRTHARA